MKATPWSILFFACLGFFGASLAVVSIMEHTGEIELSQRGSEILAAYRILSSALAWLPLAALANLAHVVPPEWVTDLFALSFVGGIYASSREPAFFGEDRVLSFPWRVVLVMALGFSLAGLLLLLLYPDPWWQLGIWFFEIKNLAALHYATIVGVLLFLFGVV